MTFKFLKAGVLFALAGCASVQLPADRLQRNQASIRGAEEMGASGVPAARLHLQIAKDETETAKHLAADGNDHAELVLWQAESDAELALGLAREASVHADAIRAADDLRLVQSRSNP